MDLHAYQQPGNDYDHLSLKDLLDAQDLYHVHLMRHPHVVATALGRYRIRHDDSWPGQTPVKKGKGERTLENSEVRPYSWPCVLAFVDEWVPASHFGDGGKYDPDQFVPNTLYLPDGRRVPVCVVRAPRELKTPPTPPVRFPLNNIGGGRPILARVQGQEHVATIACLVRDGHKVFALTNRHVTGEAGEALYSHRSGRTERVGVTAGKQLTRIPFTDLYPGFVGKNVYVNLDIGLIDVDALDDWTAQIPLDEDFLTGYTMGPLVDLSVQNLSLALIGCRVRGRGSASGLMLGEVHALFYRYKSVGGFDYIADFFIGPRSADTDGKPGGNAKAARKGREHTPFATHPGDSGTLWLLEPLGRPRGAAAGANGKKDSQEQPPYLPLAVQWGAQLLSSDGTNPQAYALATCLSTVCNLLDVDLVRDWNLDQPDTWGAVGHFSIAARVIGALSNRYPKLVQLMTHNAALIAPDEETIRESAFKGMGQQDFVHLADVPDFFWKHGQQGHSRHFEGPNHFADMDQRGDAGTDLLTLCEEDANIDPDVWDKFYDSVRDLLTGEEIQPEHRGLLPFRVWQIFDEMVRYASEGKAAEFVCAAGVLTHYVGDACQPLHISYLHDGDPLRAVTHVVHHRDGSEDERKNPLGMGVHSAYEDDMVNAHREDILDGLKGTPKVGADELLADGFHAARETVELMRATFKLLPPPDIVQEYVEFHGTRKARAEHFWDKFGKKTIKAMQAGTHLLAVLWESAWEEGGGDSAVRSTRALTEDEAMEICADRDFLPSLPVGGIGAKLKRPQLQPQV
ncbi:MAG TPA: hypothetical protein VH643_26385 [Gemmataceae bacterium]|jgi:hypothetical protein